LLAALALVSGAGVVYFTASGGASPTASPTLITMTKGQSVDIASNLTVTTPGLLPTAVVTKACRSVNYYFDGNPTNATIRPYSLTPSGHVDMNVGVWTTLTGLAGTETTLQAEPGLGFYVPVNPTHINELWVYCG
jgi:hypothetical protein